MTPDDPIHDLDRHALLERLGRWNRRLGQRHAEPLLTVDEAAELPLGNLRRVVAATADRLTDVIANTSRA